MLRTRTPLARLALGVPAVVLAVVGLSACSGDDGSGAGARVAEGNPAACPGDVVDVVVSVSQWGGIVEELGGDCATVTTVVASAGIDPHDFEPNVADIAAFSDAQLVVVNGSGYDNWAITAAANVDEPPVIIRAAEVAGLEVPEDEHGGHEAEPSGEDVGEHAGHGGVDPHLWYEPDAVAAVSASVSEWLIATSPDAADYFAERRTAWTTRAGRVLRRGRRGARGGERAAPTRPPSRCSTGWPPPSGSPTRRRTATAARPATRASPRPAT